jgi:hypothetical protein
LAVTAAQAIIGKHVLPEWRAPEAAPRVLEAMAQDIADAMQAARSGAALPRAVSMSRCSRD